MQLTAWLLVDSRNFTAKSRTLQHVSPTPINDIIDRQLDVEAMVASIRALEALAHERTVAKLKMQPDENATGTDSRDYQLPYDPASVFLLETMVSISCHAPQYIEELW